ncbi:MAG: redoxin domain-containing protein [Elusimicrobia bacterium]|nr:redoxin domain-containing protein [Elusimicrobiota bacterium]
MSARSAAIAAAVCGLLARAAVAATVPDFRLLDHNGVSRELYRYADKRAIVLIVQSNGCPIFRKSAPDIKALRARFEPQGVAFLLLNPVAQDGFDEVAAEMRDFGIDLPVLMDRAQIVAETLGATRASEAFVIDPKGWSLAYRGAIDDRLYFGGEKAQASAHYVADALSAVLGGKSPATARTEAFGCLIRFERPPAPSYARDVGPVLKQKCAQCHWGPDAPTPLRGYEDAKKWAPMIRETVMTKRMPPWSLDPRYWKVRDDPSLSDPETRSLIAWIDGGAPRGDGPDPLKEFSPDDREWPLGPPDIVLSMSEFQTVPASGAFTWQYFEVAGPLENDLWIRGAHIKPGNLRVVHHANLMLSPQPLKNFEMNRKSGEMLGLRDPRRFMGVFSWVPGMSPVMLPEGTAFFFGKGAYLTLEMHYTVSGKEERDKTKVGLYLYKGADFPKRMMIRNKEKFDFVIPPKAGEVEIYRERAVRFGRPTYLLSIRPHMHYRGARMRFTARFPDGREEPILSVTDYDFNWQYRYILDPPRLLPRGTEILVDGAFDNSARKPGNPDSSRPVSWGLSTRDEMFRSKLEFYFVSPSPQ